MREDGFGSHIPEAKKFLYGSDNVNFYHYPSYISLAKSSLPKLLTYLILNFTSLL